MLSPEKQQIEIFLLKSNLEEIGNDLVVQRSALPELDAECEKKYRETILALRVARALNFETERLKEECLRLTANRMQLKWQCEVITDSVDDAREIRNQLENLLKEEEYDINVQICKYEEFLGAKAESFRKSQVFINGEVMRKELEKVNQNVIKLEIEEEKQRNIVQKLKNEINSLIPEVPDDTLETVGKHELEKKLKELTIKCAELLQTRDRLLRLRKNIKF